MVLMVFKFPSRISNVNIVGLFYFRFFEIFGLNWSLKRIKCYQRTQLQQNVQYFKLFALTYSTVAAKPDGCDSPN